MLRLPSAALLFQGKTRRRDQQGWGQQDGEGDSSHWHTGTQEEVKAALSESGRAVWLWHSMAQLSGSARGTWARQHSQWVGAWDLCWRISEAWQISMLETISCKTWTQNPEDPPG